MSVNTRVASSNQNNFSFIKTNFVSYISLFYRVRELRRERIRIEKTRIQGRAVTGGYGDRRDTFRMLRFHVEKGQCARSFSVYFELWNDADTMRVLAMTVVSVVTIIESLNCC